MFAAESSHGRGCTLERQKVPGRLCSPREELPVSEANSRVYIVFEPRHNLGRVARTNVFEAYSLGETLTSSFEDLRDFLMQPYR